MSTERLGDDGDLAPGTPAGAVAVLDLDAAATSWGPGQPVNRHLAPLRSVAAGLALLGITVAGVPEPRVPPSSTDLEVRISPAVEFWDGAAEPLGATKVVVHVRNRGTSAVEVSRIQVVGVGSPPTAQLRGAARLDAGDRTRIPVTVLPDCRGVAGAADANLTVHLTARGPSGGGTLRVLASTRGHPLAAVCPEQRPGVNVVLTGHRVTPDGSAVALRLVNAGTETVLVGDPLAWRSSARLVSHPALPVQLAAGEAKIVRVRWTAACPPSRAVAVPELEARGQHGWRAVRDPLGAVPGVRSAAGDRC